MAALGGLIAAMRLLMDCSKSARMAASVCCRYSVALRDDPLDDAFNYGLIDDSLRGRRRERLRGSGGG